MGQKVNIGGDRLGSGHKQMVELKSYERSTHDLGYLWRSSMAPGTLVPFMVEVALPGDTFDIDLQADVKTHPTLGPLFGSFKLQLDIFEAPVRLYHSALLQNTTQIGNNIASVLLPTILSDAIPVLPATANNNTLDGIQINQSALLAYLGIRGWGLNGSLGAPVRNLNAIPLLAYWEIYKNYYANKQELVGHYIAPATPSNQNITNITLDTHIIPLNIQQTNFAQILLASNSSFTITYTGAQPDLNQIIFNTTLGKYTAAQLATWTNVGTTLTANPISFGSPIYIISWNWPPSNTAISIQAFNLTNVDFIKQAIFSNPPANRYQIVSSAVAPYGPAVAIANTPSSQNGLGIKTYQSDLFNNWMQTTWYTNIQAATAVSTAGGSFNVDALILARKVYDLLNRIAISGGTYHDWINAAYDHEPFSLCNTPVYHGGLSKEIIFQQVLSTSVPNPMGTQPLGTLAGHGAMSHKHKGGKIRIKIHEHAYLIGIVSITPRLDYSQGNAWHTYAINTMNDFHKPALDQIGFQNLITEQLAWWDTQWNGTAWVQNSAGFQPAWLNYMTNVNKTYGNFAIPTNEMFMTLNRRYTPINGTGPIADLTTYIDPTHYNFIFAQTSLDAQNFWVQIAVDNTARRKMSAKIMPNL